jgi:hypothetical protein
MQLTEDEKKLLGLVQKLESPASRKDLINRAEAMVWAQDAMRADYNLAGYGPMGRPEVPSTRAQRGVADPVSA